MGANGESTSGTASSAKKLEHYLALGSALDSSAAAVDLIGAATAEPGLLAFQELLELPGVRALEKSDEAACRAAHGLLLTFAYGTWSTGISRVSVSIFRKMSSDSFMFLFPDGFIFRFVTGLQIFFGV